MKRIKNYISVYVLMLLLCCNVCSTYAQSADEFCGDWVGTYNTLALDRSSDEMKNYQLKLYIRINKSDVGYTVRIKGTNIYNTIYYMPACENVSRQGNTLYFTMDYGEDHDWSGNTKKNGHRVKYSHKAQHASVTVVGTGTLHYNADIWVTYYGDSGKIGDEKFSIKDYQEGITLYRDDGW